MQKFNTNILLAKYVERLPQVCRIFYLYSDRVEVSAKWTFGKSYNHIIWLKNLSGQTNYLKVKNNLFYKSIAIGSISIGAVLVLSRPVYPELIRQTANIFLLFAIAAFFIALISLPRRYFINFQTKTGKPGLDICKTVFNNAKFYDFIQKIRNNIKDADKF